MIWPLASINNGYDNFATKVLLSDFIHVTQNAGISTYFFLKT
jgi:hypothetical protein